MSALFPLYLCGRNAAEWVICMKGIKIGIVGVCLCLLGVAFSTNNVLAYGCATIGLVVAIIGCFTKDK